MKKFQVVFFDFDGTLVESGPGIVAAMRLMLEELSIAPMSDAQLMKFVGPPLYDSFTGMLGLKEEAVDAAVALYRKRYDEVGAQLLKPFAGVMELLAALKKAGVKTAVATCKVEETAKLQAHELGMMDYLHDIAGLNLSEGRTSKMEVLMELLRRFDVAPEDTILVGDRFYDGEGAKLAGVPFLAALYGYGEKAEFAPYDPIGYMDSVEALKAFLLGEGKE